MASASSSEVRARREEATSTSRIDQIYEVDFAGFVQDTTRIQRKELQERWRPGGNISSSPSEAISTANHPRNIDAVPLEGANPDLPIYKAVSTEPEKSEKCSEKAKPFRKEVNERKLRVLKYLQAEALLKEHLETVEEEQTSDPSKHPQYASSWTQFYTKKYNHNGGQNVAPEEITDEWKEVWRGLYLKFHAEEVALQRNRLLHEYRLVGKDVKDLIEQIRSESEPPVVETGQDWSLDVISNLRFLTTFEMILGDLGLQVLKYLYRATDLDAMRGHGASNEMIYDADFIKLVAAVRDKLLAEIAHRERLDCGQLNVAKACVGSLTTLMEKSKRRDRPEVASADHGATQREQPRTYSWFHPATPRASLSANSGVVE